MDKSLVFLCWIEVWIKGKSTTMAMKVEKERTVERTVIARPLNIPDLDATDGISPLFDNWENILIKRISGNLIIRKTFIRI